MKTLKLIGIALITVLLSVNFVACSSDSDDEGGTPIDIKQVVGSWRIISSTDVVNGKTLTDAMVGKVLTVNSDGTYSSNSVDMGNGTYTCNGNTIVCKNTSGVTITAKVSLSGNNLTMEGSTSKGVTFKYVFEKK